MEEEKDDSDQRMNNKNEIQINQISQGIRCIKAVSYKCFKIQQKNYCSNICQVITPLLCLLFTLAVRIITGSIVTSQIKTFKYPQPLDVPIFYNLIPQLNLSCKQLYFYQNDDITQKTQSQKLFSAILRRNCPQNNKTTPQFRYMTDVGENILNILDIADKQPFERGQDLKIDIPDGLFKIHSISQKCLNLTMAVNDLRLGQYHRNNGITKIIMKHKDGSYAMINSYIKVTEGAMSISQKIARSFLQQSFPKQMIIGSYMYMPFQGQDRNFMDKVVNVLGSSLYPLGLSMLLPLFLYSIVSEKQQKLIQIMKMNGLNVKYYWVVTFIFNLLISTIVYSVFYIFGYYVLQITIFTSTSFSVIWSVFMGWAIAQISLTSLVQIFISDSKTATIVGYSLSIFSTLTGQPLAIFVYSDPLTIPLPLLLYPPFALCRLMYLIGLACSNDACYNSLSSISPQMFKCLVILYGWIIMFIVSIWLNDMVQQDYGVAHRPPIIQQIKRIICFWNRKQHKHQQLVELQSIDHQLSNEVYQQEQVDESITKQVKAVDKMIKIDTPLICKDLVKKYDTFSGDKQYIALKPLTISIHQKSILGLLGPNGAGKTTLISVLTGMYPRTSGNAWIKGLPVGYSATNKFIGVCPQFDLLWPDLTVYQHLRFYCLLKGVPSVEIQGCIDQYINEFDLNESKNKPSKHLSGGMKRRLSIANGLVGNPSVVFLDEPSSGLDPGHRRQLWNILLKCAKKTSILLTTHLMQQAQVLCDRVGIIDHGNLKCIGTVHDLKQKFGQGYRLCINFQDVQSNKDELITYLKQKFNVKVVNELSTRIILKIQKNQLIKSIQLLRQYKSITWQITQPSLYDVFVDFVK